MKKPWVMLGALLLGACGAAFAAGGADPPAAGRPWSAGSKGEDPAVTSAKAAIAAGDYAGAQVMLRVALASSPGDADLHNLYAYSIRKGKNPDMQLVFKHYEEALRIDPKHRGATEYLGEAYLMTGNPAKAKEQLASLDKLCFFGCPEYDQLKKSIADYEAKPK